LPMLWRIPKEMKRLGTDIVFAGEVLPVGTAVWILSLLRPALRSFSIGGYGVFVHGLDLALTGRKRWIARQVLSNATWVITNSEHTKKTVLGYGVDPKKIYILTPCPSSAVIANVRHSDTALAGEESRNRHPGPDQDPIVMDSGQAGMTSERIWRFLTVARFVERKGYDTAVAVVEDLKKRVQAFEWTFIGDGPDKKRIQELVQVSGVNDSIRWLDAQTAETLSREYQRADLFVFLPRELQNGDVEGFGMVCLEAALYGLPVVAANSGGVAEAVLNGVTGVLTSPTDVQKIAHDIIRLMNDSECRKKMGEAGRERVLKDFRWEDRVQQLFQIIASASNFRDDLSIVGKRR